MNLPAPSNNPLASIFEENSLSLVYFTSEPKMGRRILMSGANALLLDCETAGKFKRQNGYTTQINNNNPNKMKELRAVNKTAHLMCRVNNIEYSTTRNQIESAINYGVNTIVHPITENIDQVKRIKKVINGRANLIIMIESQKGVDNFSRIAQENFDGVYVGLNDLSISRGNRPLFEPLVDGSIEYLMSLSKAPFGVGGATDPSLGYPVNSAWIISQYARLGINFTVLRRSFDEATTMMRSEDIIKNIKSTYQNSKLISTKHKDRRTVEVRYQ